MAGRASHLGPDGILATAAQLRLDLIQSRLSLAATLCALAETAIGYQEVGRADSLVEKLWSTADMLGLRLAAANYLPAHWVPAVRGQVSQLKARLLDLEAQVVPMRLRFGAGYDGWTQNPYLSLKNSLWISDFLASAVEATGADSGNVQLFDSANRVLRIVAQRGFSSEFLDYFDTVCDGGSACGAAMNRRCRVFVPDVACNTLFKPETRGVLLRAKVRAVQSSPLTDRCGALIGIVSTHYDRPIWKFPQRTWQYLGDVIAAFGPRLGTTSIHEPQLKSLSRN